MTLTFENFRENLKECPLCHSLPDLFYFISDEKCKLYLKCPCGDRTMGSRTLDQAVDDWNAGITEDYVKEVSE